MNLKVFLFTCLIVALIASESEAKRKRGGNGRGRKGGNFGKFGGGGAKRQVRSWCNNFEDDAIVDAACSQMKANVEDHMDQMKSDTKTYLEQQKADLEAVVKAACKSLDEDEGAMTCNGRIKANICSKLLEDEGQ